ncbi:uracil-DNA glycosylase [Brucella rhizosphaerae]|uniref:Uracil DNA glycosylase superfamily protein n=1 Tax=Brucella rhizosphaerae TaxID=571254 RepID=A0A256FN26_9HYPH|nr:uracil-DNA glycosylase [Brucella rhizosphaerae]OYR16168.1 uracil DNA glycosylase superfamily protein [Brucella rhizosphaerae]
MAMLLRAAMEEFLSDWSADLKEPWRDLLGHVALDFEGIASELELEVWEPIFPVRRGKHFPGMPVGTHCLRAFDGISPDDVTCVVLGQDPYPEPGFATGRAFEAGNLAGWNELNKMFSKSIRAYTQQIVAARTGDLSYARDFSDWPKTLAAIENGAVALEHPSDIADRWVSEGALLLNASLTLTRFKVDIDPHQSQGHLVLWRPLIVETLRTLASRGKPLVFLGFGDAAAQALALAGIDETVGGHLRCVLRDHPARADEVLARPNPFILCNDFLEEMGAQPIAW